MQASRCAADSYPLPNISEYDITCPPVYNLLGMVDDLIHAHHVHSHMDEYRFHTGKRRLIAIPVMLFGNRRPSLCFSQLFTALRGAEYRLRHNAFAYNESVLVVSKICT
jgi:hypothetical protein